MQSTLVCRSLLILALAAPFAASASPLGEKPGAWDGTSTATTTGLSHAIPKEKLAQMPPEQRQQLQAYLKTREGKAVTNPVHHCVKASDTVQSVLDRGKRKDCTTKILQQTSNALKVRMVCKGPDGKTAMTGIVKVTALSSTHVVSSMDMKTATGVHTRAHGDSHWVSDTCPKS